MSSHVQDSKQDRKLMSSIKRTLSEVLPCAFSETSEPNNHLNSFLREEPKKIEEALQSLPSQPKLTRSEYLNQKKKKNPIISITQYITNAKYNSQRGFSLNQSAIGSAFALIGNQTTVIRLFNQQKQIISYDDLKGNLLKPLALLPSPLQTDSEDNDHQTKGEVADTKKEKMPNSLRFGNNSAFIDSKYSNSLCEQSVFNQFIRKKKAERNNRQALKANLTPEMNQIDKGKALSSEDDCMFPLRPPFEFDYTERKRLLKEYYDNKIKQQQQAINDYLLKRGEERKFEELILAKSQSFEIERHRDSKPIAYQVKNTIVLNYDKEIRTKTQEAAQKDHGKAPCFGLQSNVIDVKDQSSHPIRFPSTSNTSLNPFSNHGPALFQVPKEKQDDYKEAEYESVILETVTFGVPKNKVETHSLLLEDKAPKAVVATEKLFCSPHNRSKGKRKKEKKKKTAQSLKDRDCNQQHEPQAVENDQSLKTLFPSLFSNNTSTGGLFSSEFNQQSSSFFDSMSSGLKLTPDPALKDNAPNSTQGGSLFPLFNKRAETENEGVFKGNSAGISCSIFNTDTQKTNDKDLPQHTFFSDKVNNNPFLSFNIEHNKD